MVLLEAGQAACSILLPYAIKQIMDAVTEAQAQATLIWDQIEEPLWLFGLLNMGKAFRVFVQARLRKRLGGKGIAFCALP